MLASRSAVLAIALGALLGAGCGANERAHLQRALVGRGQVAVLGEAGLRQLKVAGTQLTAAESLPPIAAALTGSDPAALVTALAQSGVSGVLVGQRAEADAQGVAGQLAHFARIDGLQGVYFDRDAALYALDPLRVWSPSLRAGLAQVARRLIGGAPPPQLRSFPEQARKLDPVEVMVLLRSGDTPRLWRSARGSSFARALLTASAVARQRWIERAAALGGRLEDELPHMVVELSLLQDDGEIGVRTDAFIDRVVTAAHGVGFERKGGWHYLLPDATHRDGRPPSRAYRQLFRDDGLPPESLDDSDIRLYRVAVQPIGVSEPPPDDGLSGVTDPKQVLDK
jgi:hypothetical protein